MQIDEVVAFAIARRRLLKAMAAGASGLVLPAATTGFADLHLPGGPSQRRLTSDFPGKGEMILQRAHPPLLETPMHVFDREIFTPNDQFFVRWHWGDIPTAINVREFRLQVGGAINRPLSLGLADLMRLPRMEIAAVNQCSGNSRGLFRPRVPGAQWSHGAMGNALWLGVSLRHVLDLAGVKPNAVAVRFGGLDRPLMPDAPDFTKALSIDHCRDGEVMLAYGMNGTQLPLLNGFPLRLVVPGWYSTYWMKMLNEIEVLEVPDDRYWMAKAYKIPDTPGANVEPGAHGFPTLPINRMVPRSWVTSLEEGQEIAFEPIIPIGGIAMGGGTGVARVEVSSDHGRTWRIADLGPDHGKYSFRRWDARVPLKRPGPIALMAKCTNQSGVTQSITPIWNPSGFMRSNVEITTIMAV